MRKEVDTKGQLSMIDHTTHGEQAVRFYGSDLVAKDQSHFRGQLKYMIENYCNGEFWDKKEWINNTGFFDADRILRKIARGEVAGYCREKKKFGNLHWKYRIVKK